jgi:hypothetical protein
MRWEFFLPLVSFLGLVLGIALAKISPEEMRPGKTIFKIFHHIALLSIIATLIYFSQNIFIIILGLIIGYFFRYDYIYLGLALATSFLVSNEAIFIIASLIFIYGFPKGTLLESSKKTKFKSLILTLILFLIPFLIIFLPKMLSPEILFGLSAGLLAGHFRYLIFK